MSKQPGRGAHNGQAPNPLGESLRSQRVDTPARRVIRRFFRHKLAIFGLISICFLLVITIAAPFLSPYPYYEQDYERWREGPSSVHLLGTDSFGRDVLSRLMRGGRVSLSVGLVSVAIYEVIAIGLGAVSGYYGGKLDWIIMRFVDVFMTFPWLLIIIFMVSILGPSLFNTMLAIGILGWPGPARLVRGQILSLREMEYVTAARSVGLRSWRIITRHVLPGLVAPMLVNATFGIASAILMEAALSFLNLGVQPPEASWGNMMSEAQELIILERMPWLWIPPGVCIMLAVLSINFIGDGLRDALDPRAMSGMG